MATTYEDILNLFRDTDRKFQETDRQLNPLEKLFTSPWGKLMESLVEGDLVNLLNARGIAMADTTTRLKGKRPGGENYEFDLIAHNGDEIVVVEVKTTLRPKDVTKFPPVNFPVIKLGCLLPVVGSN